MMWGIGLTPFVATARSSCLQRFSGGGDRHAQQDDVLKQELARHGRKGREAAQARLPAGRRDEKSQRG